MRSLPSLPAGPAAGEEEEDEEEEEEEEQRKSRRCFLFEVSVIASLIHQSCGRQMQRERIVSLCMISMPLLLSQAL